jgi:hypothetical protein
VSIDASAPEDVPDTPGGTLTFAGEAARYGVASVVPAIQSACSRW